MQKLTHAQKKIAHLGMTGQSMVKGDIGTGKTTIGIARMLYLLEATGEKLLMVLAEKEASERAKSELMAVKNKENMSLFQKDSRFSQGKVYLLENLLTELANTYLTQQACDYLEEVPETLLEEGILEVKKTYPRVKSLKEKELLQEEIKWIYAKGYTTEEGYLEAERVGCTMKWPKRGKTRKAMWQLKVYVENQLQAKQQMLIDDRDLRLLEQLKQGNRQECYKHLIVDDVHLLTQVQLELLGLLRKEGEVLFLTHLQKVPSRLLGLSRGQSYKQLGYDMTGRVKHLSQLKGKGAKRVAKKITTELTPLEIFMQNQAELYRENIDDQTSRVSHMPEEVSHMPEKKVQPWYIATYKYINKITGVETVFEQDTSAGENYIDEVKQEDVQSLPIYSDIAAGMPIEVVEDSCGTFELPGELLGHKKNTYMLHVQGDSMIGAGIEDGDYVVIQSGSVSDREIAAVYYNGAITLKRIVQEEDCILLVSENPKYRPIRIEDGEFRAMGKLIGVLKNL